MINNIKFKVVGCFIVAILTIPTITAQSTKVGPNTPATVDRINMESLWLTNTDNVAGAIIDMPNSYSLTDFDYNVTKGNFKRAQSGQKNNTFGFHTEGGGLYNNMGGMYAWGEFNYSRSKIRGAEYNASLIDPLRGMPFIIADTHASNWINQDYNMKMKVATPKLWNSIIFGIEASYQNTDGAKQMDPHPEVLLSKIELKPAIIFTTDCQGTLGVNFAYFSRRESGSANNSNGLIDQTAYEMVYPGFFTEGQIGGAGGLGGTRNCNANSMGGGIQYGYKSNDFNFLITGNYAHSVEDVTTSYERPKMVGTVKNVSYDFKLVANINTSPLGMLALKAEYFDRTIKGIEYIQVYDNTYDVQGWVTNFKSVRSSFATQEVKVDIDYMIKDEGNSYKWKFGVNGLWQKLDNIYYMPESTQSTDNYKIGAYVNKNFKFNDKHSLLLGLNGALCKNTGANHTYYGNKAEHILYTDWVRRDYYYLSSGYSSVGASLMYMASIMKNTASIYFGADYTQMKADNKKYESDIDNSLIKPYELYSFSNRSFINFKVGLAF